MEENSLARFAIAAVVLTVLSGTIWMPVVFTVFAIGRRQYSLRFVLVAVAVESIFLVASIWVVRLIVKYSAAGSA